MDNLGVPFCAVTSEVISRNTFDIVHTYGRALECSEFGSKIDFKTSFETGWCIWNYGNQFKNHFVFHNGRLHANTSFELTLYHEGEELISLNKIEKELRPFESCRINLEEESIHFSISGASFDVAFSLGRTTFTCKLNNST